MQLARNLATLARTSGMAGEYLEWLIGSTRGKPCRTLLDGIEVGGFANFSEYHSVPAFINATERRFFETTAIGAGPIIDVGANIGLVSLVLARRFPERQIHAFEPNPTTFAALQENIARNRAARVACHRMAVADTDGIVMFDNDPIRRGTASISFAENALSAAVPAVTLDSFCAVQEIAQIGLLKIDVEGFETLVLRGATRMLAEKRVAVIYFEVCPPLTARAGFDPLTPARMLLQAGYELRRLTDGGLIPAVPEDMAGIEYANWLAVWPGHHSTSA